MDHIQPGQMLGPYRIISQVGEGGMATVYKAYHAAMDRYVAIKVLPPEFARSAQFKGRFQQEARLIANLEHPHILPVHDVGESDGIHFFVMRFLDTGTLTNRIESGPLTLAEIDRIFSQIADALGYAHGRNIIHRDIKPSNVLIDARGSVFLTDFGIAKILEGDSKFSTTGSITGTPAYMSPEQAQGERVDLRSDIYSLGILLYEMVTGRVPFEAETPMAVALKHISAPLPLPSSIKPDVDPEVERVILKALAKDRNDRFASCQEFSDAWQGAYQIASAPGRAAAIKSRTPVPLASATVTGNRPITKPDQPLARPKPAWPIWVAIGALVALIVCVGLPLGAWALFSTWSNGLAAQALTQSSFISPTPGQSAQATPPPPNASTPTPAPAGPWPPAILDGQWANWLSSNLIYHVAVDDDLVYTLSPGTLTIWNRTDGSIVKRLTPADGLPSDSDVTNLFIDRDGLLWIGTYAGLYSYDGQTLTLQTRDAGLDSNNVNTIYQLSDGRMLVGTSYSYLNGGGGLNFYNGQRWLLWPDFPSLDRDNDPDGLSDKVTALAEGLDGTLWVGTTTGLGRYDGSTWTRFTTADGLPHNNIRSLSITRSGTLLIGTEEGAAAFTDGKLDPFPREPGPKYQVQGLIEDSQGRYWFSGNEGVRRFDPATQLWKHFEPGTTELTSDMFGLAQDSNGTLYFGSNGKGLMIIEADDTITNWQVPNTPRGYYFYRILAAPANKQLGFLGNGGFGIDILDSETDQWENIQDYPGAAVALDPAGNLWNNEWPTGFWILGMDGSQTHVTERHGLQAEQFINDFGFASDGTTWLATSLGLAKFDGQTVTTLVSGTELGLPDDGIIGILVAKDGSLWLAGSYFLAHYQLDHTWETFGSGNPFQGDQTQVRSAAEDANGAIWIGTNGEGLFRYANGEWTQFIEGDPGVKLPSDTILALTLDQNNNLWIGTEEGLAIYGNNNQWASLASNGDTYLSPRIIDIYIAPDGTVYLALSGGVARLKP